jgi:hypothetical protein
MIQSAGSGLASRDVVYGQLGARRLVGRWGSHRVILHEFARNMKETPRLLRLQVGRFWLRYQACRLR